MNRSIIVGSALIATICFFFFVLPLPIRYEYIVTWAIIGGVLCCGLFLYFCATLQTEIHYGFIILGILCSVFVFGALLIYTTTEAVQNEFENNYVLVNGRIELAEGTYAVADERSKVYIPYEVPGSYARYLRAYVKWREFDLRSFNYYIPIIYSKKYPELSKMILGEKQKRKYGVCYSDTLNPKQKRMFKNINWKIEWGSSYHRLMAGNSYPGLSDSEKQVVLQHIEPEISTDDGSFSWFPAFATIMSVVFLLLKLFNRK